MTYVSDTTNGPLLYAKGDPNAYQRLVDATNIASTDDDLLNAAELEKFMETLVPGDINPDQTARLIKIYGGGGVVSKQVIVERMTADGFLQANPTAGGITWSYNWDAIPGTLIADALLREMGLPPDGRLNAEQFDEATDRLFGDYEGLNRDNAVFLTRLFGTSGTIGRDQMAGLFDRNDIHIDGVVTEDYVRIFLNVNKDNAPLGDTAMAANYILGFDGNADGMINRDEFKAALESRLGNGIEVHDHLVDDYMAFYGYNDAGGQRVLNITGVADMLTDGALYLTPMGDQGAQGFGINLNITPIKKVVLGSSVDDNLLNRNELARLFERLGFGPMDPAQMDVLIKIYGGGGVVSTDVILNEMTKDGFLTLAPNVASPSTLNWDAIDGTRIAKAVYREAGLNPDDPTVRINPEQLDSAIGKLLGNDDGVDIPIATQLMQVYGLGNRATISQVAEMFDKNMLHLYGAPGEGHVAVSADPTLAGTAASIPPSPITREQVEKCQELGSTKFLEMLDQQPEGSKGKILYNLLRARALAQLPDYKGKIDLAKVEKDIATLMQDPEIAPIMAAAQEAATQEVLGMSNADAARLIQANLLSDPTQDWLATQTKETREHFINDRLTEIAFFDPAIAQETLKQVPGALIGAMSDQGLDKRKPESVTQAVQTLFQILVNGHRGGFGNIQGGVDALAALSTEDREFAAKLYGEFLSSGQPDLQTFLNSRAVGPGEAVINPETMAALNTFHNYAVAQGTLGAIGTVLSALALYMDFSEGRFPKTAAERMNSAADVMSMLGQGENLYKALQLLNIGYSKARQVTTAFFAGFRPNPPPPPPVDPAIPLDPALPVDPNPPLDPANPGDVELVPIQQPPMDEIMSEADWSDAESLYESATSSSETMEYMADLSEQHGGVRLEGQELLDYTREITDDLSSTYNEWVAANPEVPPGPGSVDSFVTAMSDTESVAAPLTAEEAAEVLAPEIVVEGEPALVAETAALEAGADAETAAVTGELVGDFANVTERTSVEVVSAAGRIFAGLGFIGGVAGFMYVPGQVKGTEKAFARGDTLGGILGVSGITANVVGSTAGILASIGAFGGVAALSGPFLPIVAVVAGVTGFAIAIGNYFHQKHLHQQDVDKHMDFLRGGVGNGQSYLLPGN